MLCTRHLEYIVNIMVHTVNPLGGPARRPRGRPPITDREAFVAAAIRIIESDGVDAVTMRRLAAELGVSPMAPYRYVASKEELLRATAASVVGDIPAPLPGRPWQDVVEAFFEGFHDRLLKHPSVARLFGGQTFLSDTVYAVSDPVFTALIEAGFQPQAAISLFMACATCSIGSAILEAEAAAQQVSAHGEERGPLVDAERFPGVAAVAAFLPSRQSPHANSTALRHIIAGYSNECRSQ
jgi:TetR/AcrR family transcriptional regulator, tetracycline repressor protein